MPLSLDQSEAESPVAVASIYRCNSRVWFVAVGLFTRIGVRAAR